MLYPVILSEILEIVNAEKLSATQAYQIILAWEVPRKWHFKLLAEIRKIQHYDIVMVDTHIYNYAQNYHECNTL